MTTEQFYDFLQSHGLTVWQRGGGCTAWGKELGENRNLIVSQDLHHEIYPEYFGESWLGVCVGIECGNELENVENFCEHHSMRAAMAHIRAILEGTK